MFLLFSPEHCSAPNVKHLYYGPGELWLLLEEVVPTYEERRVWRAYVYGALDLSPLASPPARRAR